MGSITVSLTGDEARLLRALDRVVAKEKELAQSGKDAGKAHEDAFSKIEGKIEGAITKMGAYGLAIKAATGAAEELAKVQEKLDRKNQESANRVNSDAQGLRRLGL